MAVPSQKPLTFCQGPVIVCYDKHHGQKRVGEERVYSSLWSTVPHWGKPGQKLKSGGWEDDVTSHSVIGPPPSINCQENAPDLPTGQSDGNIFSVEVLYSQMSLTCIKLIKTNQPNKQTALAFFFLMFTYCCEDIVPKNFKTKNLCSVRTFFFYRKIFLESQILPVFHLLIQTLNRSFLNACMCQDMRSNSRKDHQSLFFLQTACSLVRKLVSKDTTNSSCESVVTHSGCSPVRWQKRLSQDRNQRSEPREGGESGKECELIASPGLGHWAHSVPPVLSSDKYREQFTNFFLHFLVQADHSTYTNSSQGRIRFAFFRLS